MFKSIIIISKEIYNTPNDFDVVIINSGELIDNNSLKYVNEQFYFDYLIIDDLSLISNLNIEKEHKRAITNYNLQTSIENIFAIGNANNSTRNKNEELESIFEFLNE